MFEFEMKGNLDALISFEKELLQHLGYGPSDSFSSITYDGAARRYGVSKLSYADEARLCEELGPVVFLTESPEHTAPFWNVKRAQESGLAFTCDIILDGQETISSAERSCDPSRMRFDFYMINNGKYFDMIHRHFGKKRISAELHEFLRNDFVVRSGGGIGVTRLIKSMRKRGLL